MHALKRTAAGFLLSLVILWGKPAPACAQDSSFTYQGRLIDAGEPADGSYDFRFLLYPAPTGGNPIGASPTNQNVMVRDGWFTTAIDFGVAAFTNDLRWLEIAVRPGNETGAFTPLAPRQPLTPVPLAIFARTAANASTAALADSAGAVPWTGVTGVPGDFADGIDDNTIYLAGTGLNLSGTQFSVSFGGNGSSTAAAHADHQHDEVYAPLTHRHSGADITTGLVAEPRVAAEIARDNEILPAVLANDGPGSGLDADTVDGLHAGSMWHLGGNAGTTPGTHFIGTTDNQALEFKVNSGRALRLENNGDANVDAPNVIGGAAVNKVSGAVGATIAGGGTGDFGGIARPNQVLAGYGTVSGGAGNRVETDSLAGAVGGGLANVIDHNSNYGAIGGGFENVLQSFAGTIGGGYRNDVATNCEAAVIGGGYNNNLAINSLYGTIAGGFLNDLGPGARFGTIGGGNDNNIGPDSWSTVIAGGINNNIGTNSHHSVIGGGTNNTVDANASSATVAGGLGNEIGPGCESAVIAGGYDNDLAPRSPYTTISGGIGNDIGSNSVSSVVSGGEFNDIAPNTAGAVIAGGEANRIAEDAGRSVVGGGFENRIGTQSSFATIGGGNANAIGTNSHSSVIAGGWNSRVSDNSHFATIGGGDLNHIWENCHYATIAGGASNDIRPNSEFSAVGGGFGNDVADDALYATIPGGLQNSAASYAFAAGTMAQAAHRGAFVWGDASGVNTFSAADNSVTFRATGGYRFYTSSGVSGAQLAAGATSWSVLSDRNLKKDIQAVDCELILDKLSHLAVSHWHYQWEDASDPLNLGPMAQDFKAAFFPGRDDKSISTLEFDGVALAAIQGLNRKVEALKSELTERNDRIAQLERRLDALESQPRWPASRGCP